jgi:hypothetical protein
MAIYNLRKWRKNSKGTGAIVEMSYYDEAADKWLNVKANIPFASNYAGKNEDERPAALCAANGDTLTIKVYRFDDWQPEAQATTTSNSNKKASKKNARAPMPPEIDDGDPF